MSYNQVNISSGHSVNCQGAADIIIEVTEAIKVVNRVYDICKSSGVGAYKYHDTSSDEKQNLVNITNWHNQYKDGIDVSVHFNASSHTDEGRGVEVLYYSDNMRALAAAVSSAISQASGLKDRGAKQRSNLYVLRHTSKPVILIEVAFVDSTKDVKLYIANFENICKAICNSLCGSSNTIDTPKEENNIVTSSPTVHDYVAEAKSYVGSRCKELQSKLLALGYNCGGYGADGSFGKGTYNSLIKFQSDNGLVADGLAGTATFAKLDSLISSKNTTTSSNYNDWIARLQKECNNQGFSNQKVDGIAGSNTLSGCPTVKKGASGNITKLLQEKLGVTADGIFGANTKAAVIGFQKSKGLTADGVVGANTWRKLLGV